MKILEIYRKKIRFFKILLCITAGSVLLFSFVRNPLANKIIRSEISRFNEKYHTDLHIGRCRLKGLAGAEFFDIYLKPVNGDTLFRAKKITANLKLWNLLAGKISLKKLTINDAALTAVSRKGHNNYSFFFRKIRRTRKEVHPEMDYKKQSERLLSMLFNIIPSEIRVQHFIFSSETDGLISRIRLQHLKVSDNHYCIYVTEKTENESRQYFISGLADKKNKILRIRIFPAGNNKVKVPFIQKRLGADISMDTLTFYFRQGTGDKQILPLFCSFHFDGLSLKHKRIATEEVNLGTILGNLKINIGRNFIEIDSASETGLNKVVLNPYFRLSDEGTKQIFIRLDKRKLNVEDLFSSLPKGLFNNFENFYASGQLDYHFYFYVDLGCPDSLLIESKTIKKHFTIRNFGNSDFRRINNSFEHTVYEKDEAVATFKVGPENPDFTGLNHISPLLKNAVITSEDAFFYQHRGFQLEAMKEAIAFDIRERRFARGGSTITMQLVKNIFLNKHKTITRKLEEALIVWLIENNGLVSKDRLFEIYLNIIEWGPHIYGINQAARFYFNKKPSALNLKESLFLASIIPRPKWFMYAFTPDGQFKDYQSKAFRRIAERMVRYDLLPAQDTVHLVPDINLTGAARQLLKSTDTIPHDTLFYQDNNF